VERVRAAVLLPVRIAIKDVYDDTCTELLITASLDSGGRGRPRVTHDVTAALSALGLCVFMADVYVEALAGDAERRPQELHRFLVHCPDGRRLETVAQKRCARRGRPRRRPARLWPGRLADAPCRVLRRCSNGCRAGCGAGATRRA
jgi:hypothetical protein